MGPRWLTQVGAKSWGFLNRLFGTGSNIPPLQETTEFVELIRVAPPQ